MLYRPVLRGSLALTLVWVVGCAQGAHDIVHLDDASQRGGGDDDGTVDAPDRHPPDDSGGGCNVAMQDLLRNGNFDATPTGTMWTQNPVKASLPIIVTSSTPAPQSGNTIAWLGGVAQADANDSLYEEVTVPAATTSLVLTGYYWVATQETSAFAFDLATVELIKPDGTQIETIMNLDNTTTTTGWTAIDFTANEDLSGQTVRLRFSSTNDSTNVTNFFYDTLAFTATYCR